MALIEAIFAGDSGQDTSSTILTASSSPEIVFGQRVIIALNASADMHIKFGQAGMTAASSANFRIPAGVIAVYVLGHSADRIRLFNPGTTTLTYWAQVLSTN